MFARVKNLGAKESLPPGSLVHVGEEGKGPIRIHVLEYDAQGVSELDQPDHGQLRELQGHSQITWFRVEGVHQVEVVARLGEIFGLHPLVQEDIVNTRQRPKLEEYENYLFIVLKDLDCGPDTCEISSQQVSLILGKGWVLSFTEGGRDPFSGVAQRIEAGRGRIRRLGSDYLAYALVDAVVDHYFTVLENLVEATQAVEDELDDDPSQKVLHTVHGLKRQGQRLRKAVWPLRELVGGLERGESELVDPGTKPFLRDVYDHTIQIIDATEGLRDTLASMMDLYLSVVSNRMNQVMKVLTIIATLFIPLTFIAGVYGMNFKVMPELDWKWGYFATLGVMGAVTIGMLIYFWRKKWL
ncbi:MAG: magnesium/cobalt transporter CorA [Desulfarculaceae bacterium]|nr:magnesium/cobalt transporter CorA [Desulfarculaceae bacterium]MCF8071276.1 magnesium/cobalt transporter CorA [Desulfarculaceae bacterium]MCF8101121.1 magnesium/cobalt transporter CorA [Desulfarculaceae bacterium]MCF8115330.1 magnesium/cobalt transporter CorA [Desulfarculaceae bacterium]